MATDSSFDISFIIPCYNEEKRIVNTDRIFEDFEKINSGKTSKDLLLKYNIDINKYKPTNWKYEIVFVDDGSNDNTSNAIKEIGYYKKLLNSERLKVIRLEQNQGKGAALKKGVSIAKGELILTLDADMSTCPTELFVWKYNYNTILKKNRIIIASRTHSKTILKESTIRKYVGYTFNLVVRTLTGLNIKDSQCGFKLYPKNIAKKIWPELKTNGWAHDVEVLLRAKKYKFEILELPIKWTAQAESKVKIFKDSLKMLIEIIRISFLVKK